MLIFPNGNVNNLHGKIKVNMKKANGGLSGLTKIIDTKVLGDLVRQKRNTMGLSQMDLAGICGVGNRFLSDLENGKSTVEFTKVLQVLQGLGLDLMLKQKGWD